MRLPSRGGVHLKKPAIHAVTIFQRSQEGRRATVQAPQQQVAPDDIPKALLRKRRPCGAGVSTPVWCGAWFAPNPTSDQYSQMAGTQRKTSPATATRAYGNDT